MDSQYESVNVADFDVVRSTQFVDDFTRGVRVMCSLVLKLDHFDARPSVSMKGRTCALGVEGLRNKAYFLQP